MNMDVIKPLLSNGFQYVAEVAKCCAAGILVSGTVLVVLISALPSSRGLAFLAFAGCAIFLVLYGVAGHQRGLMRMLSNLTHAHGGLLYDQTLGRFVNLLESRRPGAVAGMLTAPGKLSAGFKDFLNTDGSVIPRPLRRLGGYYVGKVDARLTQGGALPTGAVVDGALKQEALKDWAVQKMREQFAPSWLMFGVLVLIQVGLAGALWWSA